ncbi:DNA-binding protein [Variovorax sp. LG9.2]|uniref:DNA-binding protein n=1 Tax=Variovorax sp. LG9.2 TaxID=3048626 RepID=UPI002B23D085|nr:DNA-binding protein [Variovorax sp. LG9.2]MEB0060192.1 DNA-binding protein [Variovorax sp. LG9.2]
MEQRTFSSSRGVQQDDVSEACDALWLEGIRPTNERTRQKLGRGSPNTIGPMLDAWWKQKMALSTGTGPASVEQILGFPSPVLDSMRELWQSALRHSERIAEVGIETARVQLQEDRAALQASEVALGERERSLEASRSSMEETLATTRAALTAAQRQTVDLEAQRSALTGQLDETRTALALSVRRIDAMRLESEAHSAAHAKSLKEQQERHDAQERRQLLEIDRAREEARVATGAGAKELARRQAVELQASEAALAAQAAKTSLEREIAFAALVAAKHLSEYATLRTALEAMTARMNDRDSALAREADAHKVTKALLERAISAVEKRASVAPTKALKQRRGGG